MRNRFSVALLLCAATLLGGCHRGRPTTETFTWKGPVKADDWFRLRNMTGDVEIRQGSGDSVEMQFVIERSNNFAPSATVKVLAESDGVIACVVYGDDNTCSAGEYRPGRAEGGRGPRFMHGQTSVHGTITLPRTVKLDARSTNGDMNVEAVAPEMRLTTVNGDISVQGEAKSMQVRTTNGDVDLELEAIGRGLKIETTNGDVSVELPAALNAMLTMRTVNGELSFGYPGTVTTKTARQLLATLGSGGVPIEIGTTNGDVSLRPRNDR